jgi:hypothetical protein
MVNNREDGPIGTGPTLDGGGDVDGAERRAVRKVLSNALRCYRVVSCSSHIL